MNLKNSLFFVGGLIIGALMTFLIITILQPFEGEKEINESVESEQFSPDCSSYDIRSSLNEYIDFYINNDDFYVLPNPLIKYQGNCEFHIKIVRQSRQFNDIKHTNFIKAKIFGDQIQWSSLD